MDINYNEFVGVLATDAEAAAALGDSKKGSVFINSQVEIQYYVKALSIDAPARLFTGYINSINDNAAYNLDDSSSEVYRSSERVEAFRSKIGNYLFLFNSRSMNVGNEGKRIHKINRADLIAKPAAFKDGDAFVAVPVFSPQQSVNAWEYNTGAKLNRDYADYESFIDRIKSGKSIGRVSHYDNSDCPRFIVWSDDDKLCAIGPFKGVTFTALGGYILQFDNLYEIDLDEYIDYTVYAQRINPTIMHFTENVFEGISNRFITLDGEVVPVVVEEKKEVAPVLREEVSEPERIEIDPTIKNDCTLLNTFNRLCEENNLYYEPKDLTNVHTAIKTGNLVILSGMSGTGKSAIVDMYARALGLRSDGDENRVLIIPVRPSWNDDSDLLGYVDLIHMVYRASDTGFVKLLVEASKDINKDKLYVVCFDEMNLARVEHYFSQFLSILEKPVGKRRLRLYDEQYRGRLYNSSEYPDEIELKGNIRFVGTVNIDESTYHFADKVLDRANVISLHVLPFMRWERHLYTSKGALQEWSYDDYTAITKSEENTNPTLLKQFLWDFHLILQKASTGMGIGPRVVKAIETYLANLPTEDNMFNLTAEEGVDLQVKQRVLTKIRGSAEQFEALFDDGEDSIISLLDKYGNLSAFSECRKTIIQKKKELKNYGYCL